MTGPGSIGMRSLAMKILPALLLAAMIPCFQC